MQKKKLDFDEFEQKLVKKFTYGIRKSFQIKALEWLTITTHSRWFHYSKICWSIKKWN